MLNGMTDTIKEKIKASAAMKFCCFFKSLLTSSDVSIVNHFNKGG